MTELGPTAKGWLGSTGGVTDRKELFVLVRFESEEAARANSDRPEQGAWWAELEPLLDGEAAFQDSNEVYVDIRGDLDSAGFVQVMQGQVTDAVVDVGGFLGIGEKSVALPMASLDVLQQEGGDDLRVYVSQTEDELEAMETYSAE